MRSVPYNEITHKNESANLRKLERNGGGYG